MPRGKKRQPQRKNGWQEPLWNLVNRKSGTCEFRRSSRMVTCQRGFWDIWNTDNKKNEIKYFGGWRQDCRLRLFRVCTRPAWGQLVWQRVHRRGVHGEFLRAVQGTARGDGEDRHAGAFHGRPEKVRLHQGLRGPFLYCYVPCRFIHLRWGFFSFFTVSDLRRILFSGGWFHDLLPQSFFSLFILLSTDCRTFTHNPGNIGKNPGLSPDCHLSYLLPALTIYVYIWL